MLSKYADIAALLAQYAADLANPRYAARLEIATKCPFRRSIICGTTAATLFAARNSFRE